MLDDPQDTPGTVAADRFSELMGRAVACPGAACDNVQPPYDAGQRRDGRWLVMYCCADCGSVWQDDC